MLGTLLLNAVVLKLPGVSKKREVTLNSKIIVLNDVTHEKTLL